MSVAVGDVMTGTVISVSPYDTVSSCAKKLVKNKINTLLVSNEDKLLGIITSTDILKLVTKNEDLSKAKAIDIATKKVAVIKPSSTIHEALTKMKELNFRRLPVISNGSLIGVITLKDILKVDPTLYKELGDLAAIRDEEKKRANFESSGMAEGFCENCGAFSELIYVKGTALCIDCRDDLN